MPEFIEQDGETHAPHPFMDTTLCGMAAEGDVPPPGCHSVIYGDFEPAQSARSKVLTCDSCIRIVRAARAIPPRCLPKA